MENVLRWEREWVARQFYLKVNDILIINFFFWVALKAISFK